MQAEIARVIEEGRQSGKSQQEIDSEIDYIRQYFASQK